MAMTTNDKRNIAQLAGTAVGGVAGAFVANPMLGATIGGGLGTAAGSLFGEDELQYAKKTYYPEMHAGAGYTRTALARPYSEMQAQDLPQDNKWLGMAASLGGLAGSMLPGTGQFGQGKTEAVATAAAEEGLAIPKAAPSHAEGGVPIEAEGGELILNQEQQAYIDGASTPEEKGKRYAEVVQMLKQKGMPASGMAQGGVHVPVPPWLNNEQNNNTGNLNVPFTEQVLPVLDFVDNPVYDHSQHKVGGPARASMYRDPSVSLGNYNVGRMPGFNENQRVFSTNKETIGGTHRGTLGSYNPSIGSFGEKLSTFKGEARPQYTPIAETQRFEDTDPPATRPAEITPPELDPLNVNRMPSRNAGRLSSPQTSPQASSVGDILTNSNARKLRDAGYGDQVFTPHESDINLKGEDKDTRERPLSEEAAPNIFREAADQLDASTRAGMGLNLSQALMHGRSLMSDMPRSKPLQRRFAQAATYEDSSHLGKSMRDQSMAVGSSLMKDYSPEERIAAHGNLMDNYMQHNLGIAQMSAQTNMQNEQSRAEAANLQTQMDYERDVAEYSRKMTENQMDQMRKNVALQGLYGSLGAMIQGKGQGGIDKASLMAIAEMYDKLEPSEFAKVLQELGLEMPGIK